MSSNLSKGNNSTKHAYKKTNSFNNIDFLESFKNS
jgi:hypothetical protein